MALVIPFYMLLDRKGYRASRDFYRKRMGHGPLKSVLSVWRNEYNLGKVVMDRFAMYAGKKFRFETEGMDQFRELLSRESGIIMLASHVGNFELAGYSIPTREKRINALVFPGETATVMQGREALFSETNIRMVPVSEDLSHLVILNNALSDGEIVSIHADRLFGSSKRIRVPFFGEEASLPAGPFVLASAKDVPVVCTFVMKESVHRYRIFLQPIEGARQDLARTDEALATAEAALSAAGGELAALLAGQDQPGLEARAASVQEARELLLGLESAREAFSLEQESLAAARARLDACTRDAARLEGEIAGMAEPLRLAEALLASCQRSFEEARLVRSKNLVQLRQELLPETPCPLCGSLDHPYCQGAALPSEDRKALKEAQLQADGLRQKQTRMEGELATTRRRAEADDAECRRLGERLAASLARLELAREALDAKLKASAQSLQQSPALADLPQAGLAAAPEAGEALAAWIRGAKDALDALQAGIAGQLARIAQARRREEQARGARDAKTKARQAAFEASARHEQALARAQAEAEAANRAFAEASAQAQSLAGTLAEDMLALLGDGGLQEAPAGTPAGAPDAAQLDRAFASLQARAGAFAERQAKMAALAGEAQALSASLEAMDQALAQTGQLASQARAQLDLRLDEARRLDEERRQAFPDGDPRKALSAREAERRRLLAKTSGQRDQASAAADALARGLAESESLNLEQRLREGLL